MTGAYKANEANGSASKRCFGGMIIGLGSDIVEIARIAALLKRHGARFEQRVFTTRERALAEQRGAVAKAATLAKRFAAKEAAAKALGCGFRHGVQWHEIEVINDDLGAPRLLLHGGAAARLKALLGAGHVARLHVTLSDEKRYALAVVIVEAMLE